MKRGKPSPLLDDVALCATMGWTHGELTAVMAQYNPFAERAGMKKVLVKEPSEKIVKAVESLKALGFNPALLGSKSHNERTLAGLDTEGLACVHEALLGVDGHYHRRLARVHAPYMRKAEFREWLAAADMESLAWSLQILGVLSQTKAYLYWCRDWLSRADIRTRNEVSGNG